MTNRVVEGARFFPPENKLMILTVACQTPEQYGYEGQTHWTISSLVESLVRHRYFERISWTTVQRFLRRLEIKPHKMDYYLFCDDPELIEKAKTICDLYLHPPKDRVLLSYDERTAIQGKRRFPLLRMVPGIAEKQNFNYKRLGTKDLLAVFEVGTGEVYGQCYNRHTQYEFIDFLEKVRGKYPGKKLTIVLDNLSSHKTENVKEWLKKQKGEVEFVFTPIHASWLNQIELWFKELNQKCLKRLSVESLEELETKVASFIKTYNKYYKHQYNWKSDGILYKKAA